MTTLKLEDSKARQLYRIAAPEFKTILEDSFPKGFFSDKITDQVKTFEDACSVLGIKPEDVLHSAHSEYLKDRINATNAFEKLTVIAAALNEGWTPDWSNSSQSKYFPWFDLSSGFSYDYCAGWNADTTASSRLCFKSAALAKYAGTQFLDLYKDYITLQ